MNPLVEYWPPPCWMREGLEHTPPRCFNAGWWKATSQQNPSSSNKQGVIEDKEGDPDEHVKCLTNLNASLSTHWRGIVAVVTPIIFLAIPFASTPTKGYQWCAYTLCIMATYWVTECLPLAVTAMLPIFLFPLLGIMDTVTVSLCYMNDTIMMFIGSIFLAYSIEQSGLHIRLALNSVTRVGYSHVRLLFAICFITMFISMWVTNTAATTMMVPINYAILKVFDDLGLIKIYEKDSSNNDVATDITSCYYCAATFSATIGGIGTLVGTSTNLVFKGLYLNEFSNGTEDKLSFPLFSAFSIPCMLLIEMSTYLYLIVVYFGMFRPKSAAAKTAFISQEAKEVLEVTVTEQKDKLGSITFREIMVIILFGGAILLFFSRSPQVFTGWENKLVEALGENDPRYILDSSVAMGVCYLMFLLPGYIVIHKHFTNDLDDLPESQAISVVDWTLANRKMTYSFMFLLGGGFALSTAATPEYTDLNGEIGKVLKTLAGLNNYFIILLIIILTVMITNFASNVAVCTIIAPIAMGLAKHIGADPLWFNIAAGFSASYCFLLPVGTPGNLIVQGAASIPTHKMMKAGIGPTILGILFTWLCVCYWAPVIWPGINHFSTL